MIEIFGLKLSKLSYKDFFGSLVKFDKQNIIFTPNPEIMLNYMKDEEFKNILLKADYLLPDGIGLYLGAMILEEKNIFLRVLKLPYFIFKLFIGKKQLFEKYGDKICGSDLTKDLLDYSDKNNIKITIIDLYNPLDLNKIESQKSFRKNIEKIYKNLDFDYFIYDLSKKDKIIEEIKNSNSKILFSTLGMKSQEKSVIEVMEKCENIKIGLGIGSSFDYLIGFQKRSPDFFKNYGLEWLYRLITGPNKLKRFKRIYNAVFYFTYKVLTQK